MSRLSKFAATFTVASAVSNFAMAQELPPWKTFKWDDASGAYFDILHGHYCAEIPFPPLGWMPDCSIRNTESGTFLMYNQLMKEREAFGYDPIPEPHYNAASYLDYRC